MRIYKTILLLSFIWLASCTTPKEWVPISGSRADGTVTLAFDYGAFEKPELEPGQAVRVATRNCLTWGYSGAELFGGTRSQCLVWNNYGCLRQRVFPTFQCTSKNGPPPIFSNTNNSAAESANSGCGSDKDCKGDRICVMGKCETHNTQN